LFKPGTDKPYWECYAEWEHPWTDILATDLALDWGQLDQEQPFTISRTGALKTTFGPFAGLWSMAGVVEGQANSKDFLAEKDSATVRAILDENGETGTSLNRYFLLPDNVKSTYRQWAGNVALSLILSRSSWGSLVFTYQYEQALDPASHEGVLYIDSLNTVIEHYPSIGLSITAIPNNTINIEYGSFAGGQKCTMGACTAVPPFKGFKLSMKSVF
jgi:hypothetical protein